LSTRRIFSKWHKRALNAYDAVKLPLIERVKTKQGSYFSTPVSMWVIQRFVTTMYTCTDMQIACFRCVDDLNIMFFYCTLYLWSHSMREKHCQFECLFDFFMSQLRVVCLQFCEACRRIITKAKRIFTICNVSQYHLI